MKKIIQLPSEIYNRISAGEVVENPLSVVKELIENSIDAKATKIIIEIVDAGKEKIIISDNGEGMDSDDLRTCVLPHATSKIKSISDLDNITSMGFRGEALPSIASVAKLIIVSRKKDNDLGAKIECFEGNNNLEVIGCPIGTTVSVFNLFENIPARRKFLRSSSIEQGEITEYIKKVILANNKIAFKYIANSKVLINYNGNNLKNAICTIYNDDILENLNFIDINKQGIHIYGCVSKLNFSKYTTSYQTLVVNNRLIIDNEINDTINQCYQEYFMKRQYPFFVIFIELKPYSIDVNVHPTKQQIKFDNKKIILKMLKDIINITINENLNKKNVQNQNLNEETILPNKEKFDNEEKLLEQNNNIFLDENCFNMDNNLQKNNFKNMQIKETSSNNIIFGTSKIKKIFINKKENLDEKNCFENKKNEDINESNIQLKLDLSENNFKILSILFSTYILIEQKDLLYIIDQHAAHERILYDKIIELEFSHKNYFYELLNPINFEVNNVLSQKLMDNIINFEKFGFYIKPFGNNIYRLIGVPSFCSNLNFNDFISNILEILDKNKTLNKINFIKEMVSTSACKAAIKANEILTQEEIKYLLKKLNETNVLLCPHGRPIIMKVTKSYIEKLFKRVL